LICLFADQDGGDTVSNGLLSDEGLSAWKALLHYKGEASVIGAKSPFFISPNGHGDPIVELNAAIEALKNDPNARCTYPARLDFLLKSGVITISDLPGATCEEYDEYVRKVPFDRVYIVFAAEDHSAAESQMGHTIVKIAGEDENNTTREHSFSFMALMSENGNLTRYISAVWSGTEGSYVLAPYSKTVQTYIYGEKRSLWEFELNMSDEAKNRLKKHLWELKGTPINYQFITHNCNTAIEAVLNAVDQNFADNKHLFFATPTEYLKLLQERGLIKSVSVRPSEIDRAYFARGRAFYPLDAPNASRALIEGFDGGFRLSLMPTYRDMRSVADASSAESENKLTEIIARYEDSEARLETLNLIAMKTIADYKTTDASRLFRLGVEESAGDRLSPFFEWGRGLGVSPFDGAIAYVMPRIGFAQSKKPNLYAAAEAGAVVRIGDYAKAIVSYERYFDGDGDYRAFNERLNAYLTIAVSGEWDIRAGYEKRLDGRVLIGTSLYF
jgi:hypothetical protein